jgi:hypothetical protein
LPEQYAKLMHGLFKRRFQGGQLRARACEERGGLGYIQLTGDPSLEAGLGDFERVLL